MKNILYITLLVLLVICTTLIGFFNLALGSLFLTASVVAIFLANFEKISKLRLFGLEAELKNTIDEANATIKQLRSLSKAVAEPTICLLAVNGFSNAPLCRSLKKLKCFQI